MDVRIVSGRYEKALKLTLQGSCVDLCFGAWCRKGTVETPKHKDGVFPLAAWNPLPGSDTNAVGLGSCCDVSDTGELGL